MTHQLLVTDQDGAQHRVQVSEGEILRDVLLRAGLSPYTRITSRLNCGGRGLCATCGVWIEGEAPDPDHWHDRLAKRYEYPRLSCQITIRRDMVITLPQKTVWGSREAAKRRRTQ